MREVIAEGRGYISIHLTPPLSRYLEPLKEETFLSSDEVVRLVGNIQEIVHFQKEFLKNLEECVDDESFLIYTKPQEFKVSHPPPRQQCRFAYLQIRRNLIGSRGYLCKVVILIQFPCPVDLIFGGAGIRQGI